MAVTAQASNTSTNDHIQGNVDLAAGVAVAPGVVLGAAPGCRLVIAAGVCLGADVVVQARQGDLVLELGVNLGSGVLVVGHGSIGQHTCVGANSTVINPSIGACQVVAPGSLVGDPTQAAMGQAAMAPEPSLSPAAYGTNPGWQNGSSLGGSASYSDVSQSSGSSGSNSYVPPAPAVTAGFSNTGFSNASSLGGNSVSGNSSHAGNLSASAQNGSGPSVYGKTQVNRLLATLFPHRQPLNGATPEDRP